MRYFFLCGVLGVVMGTGSLSSTPEGRLSLVESPGGHFALSAVPMDGMEVRGGGRVYAFEFTVGNRSLARAIPRRGAGGEVYNLLQYSHQQLGATWETACAMDSFALSLPGHHAAVMCAADYVELCKKHVGWAQENQIDGLLFQLKSGVLEECNYAMAGTFYEWCRLPGRQQTEKKRRKLQMEMLNRFLERPFSERGVWLLAAKAFGLYMQDNVQEIQYDVGSVFNNWYYSTTPVLPYSERESTIQSTVGDDSAFSSGQ